MKRTLVLLVSVIGIANAAVITEVATTNCNGTITPFACRESAEDDQGFLYFLEAEAGYGYNLSEDRLVFGGFTFAGSNIASREDYLEELSASGNALLSFEFRTFGELRPGLIEISGGGSGGFLTGSGGFNLNNYDVSCGGDTTCRVNERRDISLGVEFLVNIFASGPGTNSFRGQGGGGGSGDLEFRLFESDGVTPVPIRWSEEGPQSDVVSSPEPSSVCIVGGLLLTLILRRRG